MAYTTINKSSDHFNTKLYTGNATANHAITGVNFKPDFLWIKPRNMANDHRIHSPLGLSGSDYFLHANANNAETQNSNCVTSFDTDGFTLGNTDPGWNGNYNYVSWNWKAAGTSGSSNTDGSVTSTVSVNTTSGFSISQFNATGSTMTFGHGLGAVPSVMLIKRTDSNGNGNWIVYHKSIGATKFLTLNDTSAETTSSTRFGDTEPTSSVATVGSELLSGGTYIAYCFAEKQGFSKFGSYTGNANADGPFIYTGFKPAWVMIKKESGAGYDWVIFDNKRLGYNDANKKLVANDTDAEANTSPAGQIDLLSNGFKIRTTDGHLADAGEYLYIAFAEAPLVGSNNVPANAR